MRCTTTILLMLNACLTASAKRSDSCHVYQYFGNETGNKELVMKQAFNKDGKIIYERADHYLNYDDIKGTKTTTDKADGVYYYIYSDSTLTRTISCFTDRKVTLSNDSSIYEYIHGANGKLQMRIIHSHGIGAAIMDGRADGLKYENIPKSWDVPDTTIYIYGANNDQPIGEQRRHRGYLSTSMNYRNFDNLGRLVIDSAVEDHVSDVTRYTYFEGGYSKELRNFRGEVTRYQYSLDKSGNVFKERKTADNGYRQRSTTETTYDNEHRIVSKKYFVEDALMTTHDYVYK